MWRGRLRWLSFCVDGSDRGGVWERQETSWSSIDAKGISDVWLECTGSSLSIFRFFVEDVLKVSCVGSSSFVVGAKWRF